MWTNRKTLMILTALGIGLFYSQYGCGGANFSRSGESPFGFGGGDNPGSSTGEGTVPVSPPVLPPIDIVPTATPAPEVVPTATPTPDPSLGTPTPTPTVEPTVTPTPTPMPSQVTDSFVQSSSTMADIVWMIDASGSMSNDQSAISNNAPSFTNILLNASVDFKLMVVTSSSDTDAELHNRCKDSNGNPVIVTNANASVFSNCALVGTNGSGREEGIEAVRRALDPDYPHSTWNPNAAAAPLNPGFLRAGADLQLIFVSDEEEQPDPNHNSSNSPAWPLVANGAIPAFATSLDINSLYDEMAQVLPPSGAACVNSYGAGCSLADAGHHWDNRYAYVPLVHNADNAKMDHYKFFAGLKASGPAAGGSVHAHAVTQTDISQASGCHHRDTTEEVSTRYPLLAQMTGGSTADICSDWSTVLNNLGLEASGLKKCFQLSHVPSDVNSISVTLDTVPVSSPADYSYVSIGNQICFVNTPTVGANISVSYQ